MLYHFAATYAMKRPVALNLRLSRHKPRDVLEFSDLCLKHNVLDLYLWLALRFPEYFVDKDACLEQKSHAILMIESSLDMPSLQQQFSHSQEYKTVRQNMLIGTPDALPPLDFGEIRQKTRDQLSKVEGNNMYIFPHIEQEEKFARSGNNSNSIRSHSYNSNNDNMKRRNYKQQRPPQQQQQHDGHKSSNSHSPHSNPHPSHSHSSRDGRQSSSNHTR